MSQKTSRLFFDSNDYKLLNIVNDVLKRNARPRSLSSLMATALHPHGIKEMAAPTGLRIAYAIVSLLGSLEAGKAGDRIMALRSLRDEVFSSATTFYHKNTARVLMQIMKELVRSQGDELKQLKLAHDFRMAYTGKPRLVREQLAKYHLLEMPEAWNQFAFDDHVHDANTKGRKSPTHLLMDAWIKGIRQITVVYYNHVEPEVVEELLEAGAILDIHVRIGIELSACFREKFVRIIWELEGFFDKDNLLQFLEQESVTELMREGRAVSDYQQEYVTDVLEALNNRHRHVLDQELELQSAPFQPEDFATFVGSGQPSLLHLAKFIQQYYHQLLDAKVARIYEQHPQDSQTRQELLATCAQKMQSLGLEALIGRFLQPIKNPSLHNPFIPQEEGMPALLTLSPQALLSKLGTMLSTSRFTLNLSNLTIQDTLELLYLCHGRITHIESFNLKDAFHGMTALASSKGSGFAGEAVDITSPDRNYELINALQKALNEDNVIALKRIIRTIIWDFEQTRVLAEKQCDQIEQKGGSAEEQQRCASEREAANQRKMALLDILFDLESFHNFYNKRYLGSRIGTGSTGQSQLQYGMGLICLDTLPERAIAQVLKDRKAGHRSLIPVTARMLKHLHQRVCEPVTATWKQRFLAKIPGWNQRHVIDSQDWSLDRFEIHPGTEGNVVPLGGIRRLPRVNIHPQKKQHQETIEKPFRYLNTHLQNTLKVLGGFIPAFLTFVLTKDWWVLAYCGAFIWFGITGGRNIIQSILGGGGLKRSPLLPWNSLVSWSRIADSLFFTGFSVPLLDYLVKTLLLQQQLGITTSTSPILLYSVMALANGIYISTHNILRGLPRSAAIGNFFRSILSIPLALVFNEALSVTLHMAMVPGVEAGLQKWAAIISKLASDCVAAVIEGLADRQSNIRMRMADYQAKISQLFSVFARLDMLFPEEDVLDLLQSPKSLIKAMSEEAQDLKKVFIINALDLMYIWMYKPRARKALQRIALSMSTEEWLIFYRSQLILKRDREISQVFVDGLVGRKFAPALSFYLDRSDTYLLEMLEMGMQRDRILQKQGHSQSA
ncbi:hypothetical protein JWJ90_05340 [Desulfobulbus rhabdoformis]|uniref:hypothetical protein n=1 Tax=Desulfobulbus rhabdoformis TaxID=34032 RepID=UPI001962C180|nr:hypothetical protein [Desulfobulbus rhabdoformis]MBM9613710.1 hypothetical protein [Desulfobulbus rhabdoformis]